MSVIEQIDPIAAEIVPMPQLAVKIDRFSYDDSIVRAFTLATLIWGLVAFAAGLFVGFELVMPSLISYAHSHGISWLEKSLSWIPLVPQLSFGRLRPLHTNAAIFAFAGNAIFAGVYYSTQRLCKARMWSDKLSWAHFIGWQLIIVSAALTLPFGITQGNEYAELEWPIDIAIAVTWLGFFGINFFMTLVKRRERHIYVALWFYIATIVAVTVLHVFNNLVLPLNFFKSYIVYAGVQGAFMEWWYGHNAVAFFLTTPFLGMMYYFVPKAADRPVYSYRLSIVHFWSLVFIYIWAGPHHLHYTALPEWASTLGMIFSLMLWMPSWGGMINGLLTLRGAWNKVATDPVLKFFVVAITFYGMSTFEGPMLAIKSVNSLSHYTDWTIAHVHSGALGWVGFMSFGMIYWLLPRLFQTKLYSIKLANLHFWIATVGILVYITSIYVAGLTEGLMWRAIDDKGALQYNFVESLVAVIPMYWLRIIGGSMYALGGIFCAVNFYQTWRTRPAQYDVPIIEAPSLSPVYVDPPAPPSPLENAPVADFVKKLHPYTSMWFHRRWERKPLLFTAWTLTAVAVASLFEIVPTFMIKSNVPTIASVKPYTPLELYGRDLYVSEGCYNCHSQMIRPINSETIRYGEYSKPGESVYDHPFQWGSRRIGPDLAREGVSNPNLAWQVRHLLNPPDVTPGSVMPRFVFLFKRPTDYDSIPLRVHAMMTLGVPYTEPEHQNAIASAKAQARKIVDGITSQNDNKPFALTAHKAQKKDDKGKPMVDASGAPVMEDVPDEVLNPDSQAIALIAYLQRLGTDLNRPVVAAEAATSTAPAATAAAPATQGAQP